MLLQYLCLNAIKESSETRQNTVIRDVQLTPQRCGWVVAQLSIGTLPPDDRVYCRVVELQIDDVTVTEIVNSIEIKTLYK